VFIILQMQLYFYMNNSGIFPVMLIINNVNVFTGMMVNCTYRQPLVCSVFNIPVI